MRVQTFGSEAAVERFNELIVAGFAWSGEVQRGATTGHLQAPIRWPPPSSTRPIVEAPCWARVSASQRVRL